MLQKKAAPPKLKTYGILVGVEIEEGETTPEVVCARISDALTWVEGVGAVEVENLGEITKYEDEEGN